MNKIKKPKFNSNIAYLIGFLIGDGCVKFYRRKLSTNYLISITAKDKRVLELLNRIFLKEFGILLVISECINKKRDNYKFYQARRYSKQLFLYLKDYAIFGTKTWRVPEVIRLGTKGVKSGFIAGLFDAEGSISYLTYRKGNKCIRRRIITINKEGMQGIQELLRDFGININLIKENYLSQFATLKKEGYSLNIYKKEHHKIFKEVIPVRIKTG